MKIKEQLLDRMSLVEFADKHGLDMVVGERHPYDDGARFYAKFEKVELKGDGVLIGCYGNGRTKEEAILNYAKAIAYRTIVFDAWGEGRREINTPAEFI